MKAGWKTVKLGDVAEITSGLWKGGMGELIEAKVYRATNFFGNGELSDEDLVTIPVETKKLTKRTLEQGDILLEKSGGGPNQPVGRVGLFRKSEPLHSFSNFTSRIRVIKGSDLDQTFLHKYLHWVHLRGGTAGMQNNSTNIRNLDLDKYRDLEIPLPPLAEQKRIVALLDEAFAGIDEAKAKAERSVDEAKAVFQSHLESVFAKGGPTWIEAPMSECLELITYGFTNPMPTTLEGPYMITAKNVVGGRIDYESSRRTSLQAFDSLLTDKSRPKIGDVLLTKDGTLGRVAVVDRPNLCVNQSVAVLRTNGRIIPLFMRDMLSSYGYQKRMIEDAGGTTIKHIYITRVDKMPVKFPASIAEQKNLVGTLELAAIEAQRLLVVFEQKAAAYEHLMKALMFQAFAGELTA